MGVACYFNDWVTLLQPLYETKVHDLLTCLLAFPPAAQHPRGNAIDIITTRAVARVQDVHPTTWQTGGSGVAHPHTVTPNARHLIVLASVSVHKMQTLSTFYSSYEVLEDRKHQETFTGETNKLRVDIFRTPPSVHSRTHTHTNTS